MPREKHSTIIDGDRYEMTLFGATQGYRLFHRLFRMLGPSLGHLLDALVQVGDIRSVDLSSDAVANGIRTLTATLHEADLDHVIDSLRKLTHVGVDGSSQTVPLSGVFEAHFQGRIGSMFKWMGWGLQVQYSSFMSAFATMMPPGEGAAPQAVDK